MREISFFYIIPFRNISIGSANILNEFPLTTNFIQLRFLGSSPSIFKVPPMNLSQLDYKKSKTEIEEMETEINSSVDNTGWY